jgi:D-aspartate ligase
VIASAARDDSFPIADTSVPIFVLRSNDDVFQHGPLAVARSAGRLGIPVHGVCGSHWEPLGLSRYSQPGDTGLDSDLPDDQKLEALLTVGSRLGPAVLIPVDDVSTIFVEDHSTDLRRHFLFPEQPPNLCRRLSSKREMHDLCRDVGIPTPACGFPQSEAELLLLAAESEFPVVLKQSDPWLPSADPDASSVLIAHDHQTLVDGYRRMESWERPNVIVQEYIPGGSDSIWIFNGYFDGDSQCLAGFTGRKLRQRGPHTGPATLGECVANETVAAATLRLAEKIGYRGIIDIGFRHDQRDGLYKLLDVNPRLGGSFRMFVGDNGLDVVRAQYLDLTGQAVPESVAPDGRKWVVEPYDLVSAVQLAREGSLPLSEWLRSWRGLREAAWLTRDDPLPFVAMGLRMLLVGLRRLARRLSRSRPVPSPGEQAPARMNQPDVAARSEEIGSGLPKW